MLKKIKLSFVTRNILLLSLVSFLTDIASEMLYPVMPLYLTNLGYGLLLIGVIEGVSEAISGLNKVFIGNLSDQTGKRNLFVSLGYGISAFAKPSIGLFQGIWFVFAARFVDRVGKGIRTAPRDAILVSESKPEVRGRVFGFHRSMDSLGAMLGPIVSLAFLYLYPSQYSHLFLIAFIPGIFALALTFLLTREKSIPAAASKTRLSIKSFWSFWKKSDIVYKKLILGFLFLSILNSSNIFLLLRAKELGEWDVLIIASYIFYNLVFAAASFILGFLSDKFGFKNIYILGLMVFSLSYGLFAFGPTSALLFLTFGLYGIFAAVEDGISKAWLSLHIPPEFKATGLGLNLTLSSLAFLVASVLTAFIWESFGSKMAFTMISLGGLLLVFYFLTISTKLSSKRINT